MIKRAISIMMVTVFTVMMVGCGSKQLDEDLKEALGVDKLPNKVTYYNEDGTIDYMMEYEYDNNNNVIKYKSYDAEGNLTNEYQWEETDKNTVRRVDFRDKGEIHAWYEEIYDDEGNELQFIGYGNNGEKSYSYEYDKDGNDLKYINYEENGEINYWDEYQYDNVYTRIRLCLNYVGAYDYDQLNCNRVSYDKDGNIKDGYQCLFDDEGKLIESTEYDAGEIDEKIIYLYNDEGQLEYHIIYDSYNLDAYEHYMETGEPQEYDDIYRHEYEVQGDKIKETIYSEKYSDSDLDTVWLYDSEMNVKAYKSYIGGKIYRGWEVDDNGKLAREFEPKHIDDEWKGALIETTYEYEYFSNGDLKKEAEYRDGVLTRSTEYYENGIEKEYVYYAFYDDIEEKEPKLSWNEKYNENGECTYYYSLNTDPCEGIYEYNEQGHCIKITYNDENGNFVSKSKWEYEYNDEGLITKMSTYNDDKLYAIYE